MKEKKNERKNRENFRGDELGMEVDSFLGFSVRGF